MNLLRLREEDERVDRSFWIMNMFFVTTVQYIYILAMVFIAADRFFHVFYNLRYESLWDIRKSLRLVVGTWTVCVFIGVIFCVWLIADYKYVKYDAKISRIMAVNVLSFFYTFSLVVGVLTYVYLFVQYTTSKRNKTINPRKRKMGEQQNPFLTSDHLSSLRQNLPENHPSLGQNLAANVSTSRIIRYFSLRKIFTAVAERTSWLLRSFSTTKFYIPFLLIFTYLILTVVPSVTRSFRYLLGYQVRYEWTFFYLCSVRLSYTVDGVIYVFLQKRVRILLWKKMVCGRDEDGRGRGGSLSSSRSAMMYR